MPDPVLVAIATALAGKVASTVYDLVKRRFSSHPKAAAALAAADGAEEDSPEVRELAEELARTEAADPEFSATLRATWREAQVSQKAERGGVINQISGNVSGKVVQARDIEGGVSF